MLVTKQINASVKPEVLFECLKARKHAFFLDSSKTHERFGQYSFIGCDPIVTYSVKGQKVYLEEDGSVNILDENAFDVLQTLYQKYTFSYESELPFVGGFVGYLGYDLRHHVEPLPAIAKDLVSIPDAFLGLYDGVYIYDHENKQWHLAAFGLKKDVSDIMMALEAAIASAKEVSAPLTFEENKPCFAQSNVTKETYLNRVQAVRDHIWNGDLYQVNFTQHFTVPITVAPWEIYKKLRTVNPAPFSAYMDFGEGALASSSPERFIQLKNNIIETRPIKGTMPRYVDDPVKDAETQRLLQNSEKDRSELLMIVDLERNDIGRVSKIGTVKVPELFCLETYETVHHLVSTVVGELAEGLTPVDLIRATFPGGSITGAPKIKAMTVIDALEPTTRNLYTGSIGYLGLNGDMDLNIVIRTLVIKDDHAYFGVGGGVVWDSDPLSEYEESLTKGKALLKTLNAELEPTL